jgi:hypothetical protein
MFFDFMNIASSATAAMKCQQTIKWNVFDDVEATDSC